MLRILLALLSVGLTATGATPLLQLASVPVSGGFSISATNGYHAPATEFAVRVTFWLPTGSKCRPDRHAADGRCWSSFSRHAIMTPGWKGVGPDRHPAAWVIRPGESLQVFRLGARAAQIRSLDCLAVIYADGASAGNAYIVNKMLAERKHNLLDAFAALKDLNADATAGNPDLNNLAAYYAGQARQHRSEIAATLQDPVAEPDIFGPGDDQVCATLRAQLSAAAARGMPPAQAISVSVRYLRAYVAMLQASNPALQ